MVKIGRFRSARVGVRRQPYTRGYYGKIRRFVRRKKPFIGISKLPKFNAAERAYIESVCNPFGYYAENHYPAKVPDQSGGRTFCLSLTSDYIWNGGGNYDNFVVRMCLPCSASHVGIIGGGSLAGAAPTASFYSTWKNWNNIVSYVEKFRIVGAALKCVCVSTGDNMEGVFRGGNTNDQVETALNTWNNYSVMLTQCELAQYAAYEGITVRYVPEHKHEMEFQPVVARAASHNCDDDGYYLPVVVGQNFSVNGKVAITAVCFIECTPQDRNSPLYIAPSPISLKWYLIYAMVIHPEFAKHVTKGHSFWSFFTNVAKFVPRLAGWLYKNRGRAIGR